MMNACLYVHDHENQSDNGSSSSDSNGGEYNAETRVSQISDNELARILTSNHSEVKLPMRSLLSMLRR